MAFGLSRKSGVRLYQSPTQRKDTSKIYLFKSLSGLKKKDKLYAIGYNLTSLGAIFPGFDVGMLGAAPYFIGQISNSANSIRKAFQGDIGALTGRGRFLGGASLINRAASGLSSAISSPTGIGAVDRAANIYVGQQKAAFLHYTRNMGKKEQLKVFVEAIGDGKVMDKEIQKQAQMAIRGNVFAKWKTLTYYKAIKTAPDPWRDNPYIQAREARRNQDLKQKRFRRTIVKEPHTQNTDAHVLQLMSMTDSTFGERDAVMTTAKVLAIDDLLTANGVTYEKSSNAKDIMRQFKKNEAFRNQKFRQNDIDKFDNITYRSLVENIDTPDKMSTLGFRGASAERLKRTKGLELDPDTNLFTTNLSKEMHDKSYLNFLSTNKTFKKYSGDSAAEILRLATDIPANPNVIQAFNNYTTKMGFLNLGLSEGAGMGQVTQGIFSILFSGNMRGNRNSSKTLAADLTKDFSALRELAGEIGRAGFPDIAEDLIDVMDPGKVLRSVGAVSDSVIPNNHFMEARKDLNQVKSDFGQNIQYGSTFNEADRLINAIPETDYRLKQLDVTQGDMSDLDEYMRQRQKFNKNKKKYPEAKREFMHNATNSRKARANVARQVLKANLGELGLPSGTPLNNTEFVDTFIDSLDDDTFINKQRLPKNLKNRDAYGRRMNQKLEREIIKFVEDGTPTLQIINHLEKEFKHRADVLNKAFEAGFGMPPVSGDILGPQMSDYEPDKFPGTNKEVRRGQSTFFKDHDNYVPSQTHIIDAIHMHDIELNGKSEDDGSGFLFREQVSFGGQNQKSKTADRIRDAVQIEFGGPATDKLGKLKNRGDRMFYLPSFFIGAAASESAAFLGIFDKGSTFKASATKAGIDNQVFKIADEGTGVFNATRKRYNEKKRQDFEGKRRVSAMFADARKAVNNHKRANFTNEGVRLANQRAMSLFKKGGGFGQINIDDVTKLMDDKEMKMFGIRDGGLQTGMGPGRNRQFNLNKLGGYRNTNSTIQMKPGGSTSRFYNDGTSQFELSTGSFKSNIVNNVFRNKDGMISLETGYTPLVPMIFDSTGHMLSRGPIQGGRTKKTAETLRGMESGRTSMPGAQNTENIAAKVELALNTFDSDLNIQAIIKNPYAAMQKTFVLGTNKNGTASIWHTDNLGRDTQSPMHPVNRMREMFFGSQFETELIRDFDRIAMSEGGVVLDYLLAAGKVQQHQELLRALRIQAGSVAETYTRVTGQALQALGNQILTEDAFRSLTMTFAVLLEANKEHFRFEMHKRLRKVSQNLKMDQKVREALNAKTAQQQIFIDTAQEFKEVEEMLGKGISFGYDDRGVPGFVTFSGAQGFRKGFDDQDNFTLLPQLLPDFSGGNPTGRQIGAIYNFNNREDAIKASLGVKNFKEIRWDVSMRLGLQDLADDGTMLRGERWAIATQLAEETGIGAGHFLTDNSLMVGAIMQDAGVADRVGNQIAGFTKKARLAAAGEIADDVMAKEIMLLDAYLKAKGMGNRGDRIAKIKQNFGFIVAEKKRKAAAHADETFLKTTRSIATKQLDLQKAKDKVRMLGSSAGVGNGAKAGRQVADDLYDSFMEQVIDDKDIAALLAAGAHNASSEAEAMEFLKNFYQGIAYLSAHQGVARTPINIGQINTKMERIFRMNLPSAYQLKHRMDLHLWTDSTWLGLAQIIRKTDYDPNLIDLSHSTNFVKHQKPVRKTRRGKTFLHKDQKGRPYYSINESGKETYKEYIQQDKIKFYIQHLKLRNEKKRYDK